MGSDLYLWEEESRVHVNVKVAPATQQLVLVIVLRRRRRRGGARPTITVYDAQWRTTWKGGEFIGITPCEGVLRLGGGSVVGSPERI